MHDPIEIAAELLQRSGHNLVVRSEPLARHTSYNVGGPADLWIEPDDLSGLCSAARILRELEIPVTVLGNGTNVLVSDRGIRGGVISLMRSFRGIDVHGEEVIAGAGVSMPLLSQYVARTGLSGYEWACGIPGSIGGSVVMNAGAHGGDTAGSIVAAHAVALDGSDGWLDTSDLKFRYRHSVLAECPKIVTAAQFRLHRAEIGTIQERLKDYRDRRRAAQPETSLCAGSIFKNPPGGSAGRLLDSLGVKGMCVGGAEVARKHANFIINTGSASAANIFSLMRMIQIIARDRAGVDLEFEVVMMGDWEEESFERE